MAAASSAGVSVGAIINGIPMATPDDAIIDD